MLVSQIFFHGISQLTHMFCLLDQFCTQGFFWHTGTYIYWVLECNLRVPTVVWGPVRKKKNLNYLEWLIMHFPA